jgi:hypothetical protein
MSEPKTGCIVVDAICTVADKICNDDDRSHDKDKDK